MFFFVLSYQTKLKLLGVFIYLQYSCDREQQDTEQEAVVLEVDVVDNDEAGIA